MARARREKARLIEAARLRAFWRRAQDAFATPVRSPSGTARVGPAAMMSAGTTSDPGEVCERVADVCRIDKAKLGVLVPAFQAHPRSRELAEMSRILDAHPEAAKWVLHDLVGHWANPRRGREGMSGEQVLRAIVVKQLGGFSYDELAFHLADSTSYRAFCRIGLQQRVPTAKTLQRNVEMVGPTTLEKVNRLLVEHATAAKLDDGRKVRFDCTVMETNIHAPSDSSLLWDSVRVLVRLIKRAQEFVDLSFRSHRRRAKRRAVRDPERTQLRRARAAVQGLITVTEKTVTAAEGAVAAFALTLPPEALEDPEIDELLSSLRHYIQLAERVLDQTRRRVLQRESVPAPEKVVSIFEPHTDVIVMDRRDTLYGRKLRLAVGASGLVIDCVVEKGNPADSTLAIGMVERQAKLYRRPPRHGCFDGAFTSRNNFEGIKKLGVGTVVFTKAKGITIREMAGSEEAFRKLRRFRAGIEATISFLKRCVGWTRCAWSSLRSFKAYTWASVVSANLLLLARRQLA